MIKIDENYYYLDIDEIVKFVFGENIKKDNKMEFVSTEEIFADTEVKEGNDVTPTSIRLTTTEDNIENYTTVKYDMIKLMLDTLYNSGIEMEDGSTSYLQKLDDLSIGNKIIINTLMQKEFLKDFLNNK